MSPDSVDPMVTPSSATLVAFTMLVFALVAAAVAAIRVSGHARADDPQLVGRHGRRTLLALLGYLAATAGVAASGVLTLDVSPPPLMLFLAATNTVAVVFALSPAGRRIARHVPFAALIGVQAFRLPLELILHRWYIEGVLPITMTFAGQNFDILSGIVAIPIALWATRVRVPRWIITGYTFMGLALLVRVASIAVLSSPLPVRQYFEGPPVQLALYVPTVWIVPICVGGALAAHLIVLRKLWMQRETPS